MHIPKKKVITTKSINDDDEESGTYLSRIKKEICFAYFAGINFRIKPFSFPIFQNFRNHLEIL